MANTTHPVGMWLRIRLQDAPVAMMPNMMITTMSFGWFNLSRLLIAKVHTGMHYEVSIEAPWRGLLPKGTLSPPVSDFPSRSL